MTLIEGVGDEVTQFFVLLLVIVIGLIAWWSTSIAEQPLIRTVLILERRTRHRVTAEQPPTPPTATTSLEDSIDTGQLETPTSTNENEPELDSGAACHRGDKDSNNITSASATTGASCSGNSSQSCEVPEVSSSNAEEISTSREEPCQSSSPDTSRRDELLVTLSSDPESNLLRNRRLAFFQSRQVTLLESPVTDGAVISQSSSTESEDVETPNKEKQEVGSSGVSSATKVETPSTGNIRIRLKYLNDDQKLVEGRLQEQLGDFKKRHFSLELSADKLVRLIFNGQVLQSDSETLQSYGLFDNCVVHCLVHQQRSGSSNQTGSTDNQSARDSTSNSNNSGDAGPHRDWDLGSVLFASLSLLLGLAWYCRYQYAQLFNATTTVALVGLTGILTVSIVGIYLPDQDGIRQ